MNAIDPNRLLAAAKTAVALNTLVHETLWSLFPDELLALTDAAEPQLLALLTQAIADQASQSPSPR